MNARSWFQESRISGKLWTGKLQVAAHRTGNHGSIMEGHELASFLTCGESMQIVENGSNMIRKSIFDTEDGM